MLTLISNEAKYYPSPKKKRKKRILLFSVVDLHHQKKKKKSSITIIIFEMLSVDKEWEFVFSCITAFMLFLGPQSLKQLFFTLPFYFSPCLGAPQTQPVSGLRAPTQPPSVAGGPRP